MDEVSGSDHLFVVADNSHYAIYGATNELGGKVIHLNESKIDGLFSYNTRSAVHEFGHTLGLNHPDPKSIGYNSSKDLMVQGGSGGKFTGGDLVKTYGNWKTNKLNKGANSIKTSDGRKIPYPVVQHNGQITTIYKLGYRYKY
ncbi:hypothetical protein JGH11_18940 [Dysgonomonas sp. Marseille-P4677]|uniref:hypothetical protein n=1 Tax=Dysgonomonas sp. Marseille-P4677 TaxID=2364790 RepID=UPI0019124FB0|nr:hypothetical protein [Dysgonomonas sp. Marseille-P4677]MBK5722950.1 hypothetical protein [Dysgonomonas sp. Marseille-P4677]